MRTDDITMPERRPVALGRRSNIRADGNPGSPLLAAAALVRTFGRTRALDGASLAVAAGGSVAVVGTAGAGKTTLLRCLTGVDRPDSGRVLFDGTPLDRYDELRRSELHRTRFGFVHAADRLPGHLTVEEAIALPLLANGCPDHAAVTAARTWLEPLGLDGLGARPPAELSRDQTRRVAVARALVTGPSVVLADEPTEGLDPVAAAELVRVLASATWQTGAALVFFTRDPGLAGWCEHVVEIRDGRLGSRTRGCEEQPSHSFAGTSPRLGSPRLGTPPRRTPPRRTGRWWAAAAGIVALPVVGAVLGVSGVATASTPDAAASVASYRPEPRAVADRARADAFSAAGYTYDDAVALATRWGDHRSAYQAKVKAGAYLQRGVALRYSPYADLGADDGRSRRDLRLAFLRAGYRLHDAAVLAHRWHVGVAEAKVRAGRELKVVGVLPFVDPTYSAHAAASDLDC